MITTENVKQLIEDYKQNIRRLKSYKEKNQDYDFNSGMIEGEIGLYECIIQDLEKLNDTNMIAVPLPKYKIGEKVWKYNASKDRYVELLPDESYWNYDRCRIEYSDRDIFSGKTKFYLESQLLTKEETEKMKCQTIKL